MKINRIKNYEVYSLNGIYTEVELIETINKEIKIRSEDTAQRVSYHLNENKTDKKKFNFENLNYKQSLKSESKQLSIYFLITFTIALVLILVLSYFKSTLAISISSAILLVFLWKTYKILSSVINTPKNLILRNGYIYELNYFKFRINSFFFDEIIVKDYESFNYIYFRKKKMMIENSLIFFANNEIDRTEMISFFKNYSEISHNILFSD